MIYPNIKYVRLPMLNPIDYFEQGISDFLFSPVHGVYILYLLILPDL